MSQLKKAIWTRRVSMILMGGAAWLGLAHPGWAQLPKARPAAAQSRPAVKKDVRTVIFDPKNPATSETLKQMGFKPRPPRRDDYTGRPLLAVGTIKSIDLATSLVTVTIDANKSVLPNVLTKTASKVGKLDAVRQREFPAERTFAFSLMTQYKDERPGPTTGPRVWLEAGKLRQNTKYLKPTDFKPGDAVSVLFGMALEPSRMSRVITLSKVDPRQTKFVLEFNPLGGRELHGRPTSGPFRPEWNGPNTPTIMPTTRPMPPNQNGKRAATPFAPVPTP